MTPEQRRRLYIYTPEENKKIREKIQELNPKEQSLQYEKYYGRKIITPRDYNNIKNTK